MKRDTQQKARTVVRAYIDSAREGGRAFARRADVCKATMYRFLSGEDVSMAAVEKMLEAVGYKLDVVRTGAGQADGAE